MSVECHIPPDRAAVVQVIHFAALRGDGTPENPVRLACYYFSLDGHLLACYDPINGPPDGYTCLKPSEDLPQGAQLDVEAGLNGGATAIPPLHASSPATASTQSEIAEGAGGRQPTISRILSGEHKDPKVSVLTGLKRFAKDKLNHGPRRRKDD